MKASITAYVLLDANIARSVSDPANHPRAVRCKEVADLLAHNSCPTGLAMTPELLAEWRKHATTFMTRWLVSMENKGRLLRRGDKRVAELRRAIEDLEDAGVKAAVLKDVHLSEAAITFGFGVISLDDRQRRYLASVATTGYGLAGNVFWVNPLVHVDWDSWLLSGCAPSFNLRCQQTGTTDK